MPQVKESSQLIHFVPGDRGTLQSRAQRTYPCQPACFQAAGSPCSSWSQFSLILVAIYLSPPHSSLSHTERWAESSTQPISHETPACLPACLPSLGQGPASKSHWAPATAMNVVLQVLPHPTPETTGQIKTVAELSSKALPWGGAAGGGDKGQSVQASEADKHCYLQG